MGSTAVVREALLRSLDFLTMEARLLDSEIDTQRHELSKNETKLADLTTKINALRAELEP